MENTITTAVVGVFGTGLLGMFGFFMKSIRNDMRSLGSGMRSLGIDLGERITRFETRTNERIASLEERITRFETRIEERMTRFETRINERITSLEERITSLEDRVIKLEIALTKLRKDVDEFKLQLSEMNETHESQTEKLVQMAKFEGRITNLESMAAA